MCGCIKNVVLENTVNAESNTPVKSTRKTILEIRKAREEQRKKEKEVADNYKKRVTIIKKADRQDLK